MVSLDKQLKGLELLEAPAHTLMDEASEKASRALHDLAHCQKLQKRQPDEEGDPVVQQLGIRLQAASSHFWKLQYGEALSALLVHASLVQPLSDDLNILPAASFEALIKFLKLQMFLDAISKKLPSAPDKPMKGKQRENPAWISY